MCRSFYRLCVLTALLFPAHAYAVDSLSPIRSPEMSNDQAVQPQQPQMTFKNPLNFEQTWYLRGDLGGLYTTSPKFDGNSNVESGMTAPPYEGVQVGVGYKFNSIFRADLTYEYNTDYNALSNGAKISPCYRSWAQIGHTDANGVTTYTDAATQDDPGCTLTQTFNLARKAVLLNGYADIGHFGNWTPYVGLGIGTVLMSMTSSTTAAFSDSRQNLGNYCVTIIQDGTPTSGCKTYYNFDVTQSRQTNNLALAAHAGVSYYLTNSTFLDIGYRYLYAGKLTPLATAASSEAATISSHELHVGLRFMLDY
jgi:opacity protein-like surface antigen